MRERQRVERAILLSRQLHVLATETDRVELRTGLRDVLTLQFVTKDELVNAALPRTAQCAEQFAMRRQGAGVNCHAHVLSTLIPKRERSAS